MIGSSLLRYQREQEYITIKKHILTFCFSFREIWCITNRYATKKHRNDKRYC